ncbi:caspase recruitment domain-containing protein 16 [Trichosurus vulpecula]|uniref:caspase recruitment domain-containing protein 16 n=1 Tax=Trichosurus vulpecula TaxID=9337 RepID=UPI00186AFCF9|nr:caspase recruitment domain-containing protein 16 [Trichosurus vulpecula]
MTKQVFLVVLAVQVLTDVRKQFVESVDKSVINGLLDDMIQEKVLNQEEIEEVMNEHLTIMSRARVLIDYIIRKGSRACKSFISHIWRRDPYLAEKLQLIHLSKNGC